MQVIIRVFSSLLICVLVNACGGNVYAPVVTPGEKKPSSRTVTSATPSAKPDIPVKNPGYHVIARGDTLYSIAFNYGLDFRDVAAWNGIRAPYTIYPGQKLKLQTAATSGQSQNTTPQPRAEPLTPGPIVSKRTEEKPEVKPVTKSTVPENPVPQPVTTGKKTTPDKAPLSGGPVKWSWPTQGNMVKSDAPISKNGIDIAGVKGQPINAAATGDVVYSGSGLLGYGRLIIIKHNENYLSAYAHNDQLLVKEGERVTAGQTIAHMGQTTNGRTLLHFEIRKNGQPVNPLTYLPKR